MVRLQFAHVHTAEGVWWIRQNFILEVYYIQKRYIPWEIRDKANIFTDYAQSIPLESIDATLVTIMNVANTIAVRVYKDDI